MSYKAPTVCTFSSSTVGGASGTDGLVKYMTLTEGSDHPDTDPLYKVNEWPVDGGKSVIVNLGSVQRNFCGLVPE